jgi:hypothetical protein
LYEVLCEGKAGEPSGLRLVLSVAGHTKGVRAVSFSGSDCGHLALASMDGEWSVVKAPVSRCPGPTARPAGPALQSATALTRSGPTSGQPEGAARAAPKAEAREYARGRAPAGAPFERVALSPFARRLVGASANGNICVRRPAKPRPDLQAAGSSAQALGLGPCAVQIVDVDAAARGGASLLETIPAGHGAVSSLCYACDGLRVLSAGEDSRLRLWRVEDDEGKAGTL